MQALQCKSFSVEISNSGDSWRIITTNGNIISDQSDFWRLFLDDNEIREITVHSKDQKGQVSINNDQAKIEYGTLISEYGVTYDIALTVYLAIKEECGKELLDISYEMENNDSRVRVNEAHVPFVDIRKFNHDDADDVLYCMEGMGRAIPDPWQMKGIHSEYMSADYNQQWKFIPYPGMGMAWCALKVDNEMYYIARHSGEARQLMFGIGNSPRHSDPTVKLTVATYTLLNSGRLYKMDGLRIGVLAPDWQEASTLYGNFAHENWYRPCKREDWVNDMTGWQRIILKHQYGEIFFKYEDLPKLYEQGKAYGLNTLLVFGWWKGRFDNHYPVYEPDDALGGADALKAAIAKVQEMGGRVLLYTNGMLIDKSTDWYEEIGKYVCKKDIEGMPYADNYRFSKNGSLLRLGYKTFTVACHSTREWRDRLLYNAKLKLSFGADSVFFDQLGCPFETPCFDTSHPHAERGDLCQEYKFSNMNEIKQHCATEGKAFGVEWCSDMTSQYVDYFHGCGYASGYSNGQEFPELFFKAFPDVVTTDRGLHDDRPGFEQYLNYAFVYGLRNDVAIYRCRKVGIAGCPAYAEYLKKLLSLKQKYAEFFYRGTRADFKRMQSGAGGDVRAVKYASGDKYVWAVWNNSNSSCAVTLDSKSVELAAQSVRVVE